MGKNTSLVESTMHSAYQLFERLRSDSSTKDAAKDALIIANDIHGNQKEYYRSCVDFSDALPDRRCISLHLEFGELFSLLRSPVEQIASAAHKTLSFEVKGRSSFRTGHVYELLSVFRNLFTMR